MIYRLCGVARPSKDSGRVPRLRHWESLLVLTTFVSSGCSLIYNTDDYTRGSSTIDAGTKDASTNRRDGGEFIDEDGGGFIDEDGGGFVGKECPAEVAVVTPEWLDCSGEPCRMCPYDTRSVFELPSPPGSTILDVDLAMQADVESSLALQIHVVTVEQPKFSTGTPRPDARVRSYTYRPDEKGEATLEPSDGMDTSRTIDCGIQNCAGGGGVLLFDPFVASLYALDDRGPFLVTTSGLGLSSVGGVVPMSFVAQIPDMSGIEDHENYRQVSDVEDLQDPAITACGGRDTATHLFGGIQKEMPLVGSTPNGDESPAPLIELIQDESGGTPEVDGSRSNFALVGLSAEDSLVVWDSLFGGIPHAIETPERTGPAAIAWGSENRHLIAWPEDESIRYREVFCDTEFEKLPETECCAQREDVLFPGIVDRSGSEIGEIDLMEAGTAGYVLTWEVENDSGQSLIFQSLIDTELNVVTDLDGVDRTLLAAVEDDVIKMEVDALRGTPPGLFTATALLTESLDRVTLAVRLIDCNEPKSL
ncbi:MAG: hypothetical protein AAF355_09750 [Myxococcota bacterium]